MPLKEFSRYLEGKNFDEVLHKGKKESNELMLAQGVAPVALFISKLMIEAIQQEESSHALS
ncbi:MAG: hypothetical protein WC556_09580 [Candidatus Methanoperedens sp.]